MSKTIQPHMPSYWYEFTYGLSSSSLEERVAHGYKPLKAKVLQRDRTLSNTHTGPGVWGVGVTDRVVGHSR